MSDGFGEFLLGEAVWSYLCQGETNQHVPQRTNDEIAQEHPFIMYFLAIIYIHEHNQDTHGTNSGCTGVEYSEHGVDKT